MRDIFEDKSEFKKIESDRAGTGKKYLPAQQQERALDIKRNAENVLHDAMRGDISSLVLGSIKAGDKRQTMAPLEFTPAKRQSVFADQAELKKKYIVLKPPKQESTETQKVSNSNEISASVSSQNSKSDLQEHKPQPQHHPNKSKMPQPKLSLHPELNKNDCMWRQDMKKKRIHSTGLFNRGNTCFLNATIQILTHTAPLWNYLTHIYAQNRSTKSANHPSAKFHKFGKFGGGFHGNNNNNFNKAYDMQDALLQHFRYILKITMQSGPYTTNSRPVAPQKILEGLQTVTNQRMRIGRQEDAHEYLRYVLDAMQKALLTDAKNRIPSIRSLPINKLDLHVKSTTALHRIFGGYTRSRLICQSPSCRYISDCYEPCLDLQMDLKGASNLYECLGKWAKKDLLCGDNAYKCERCNKKVDASKQMTVEKAPQVLTLQMKRFDAGAMAGGPMSFMGGMGKIMRQIAYPPMLDLQKIMSPELKCREMKYELYGILVHSGHTCNSGHYYSFCKSPSGTWFCYNDCNVSAVKPDVAMRQQEAYLLFYNKVSQNFAAGDPYSTSTSSVLQNKQKEQSSSNGPDRVSKDEIKRKEAQMAREILQKQNIDKKKSNEDNKFVNQKIEKSPIQQKMDLVRQTLTTVSSKSSVTNNEKKKEQEQKSSPKKNKTSALSSIMEYDDSSTNDDSSINSTSSNASRKERKRQKFLKRKAERMAKLGNLEDDDNKKAETGETSPKKPKTDNNSDNLQKYQNSSFFKLNVKSWNNQESSIDKQIDKEVRNQNNSKLDKETLAYDQDKIERAERKFEKVERKKQEKMDKMSNDKSSKTGASPNVFQKYAEKGDRNTNKFYKK